jgi:hypothetical protein
LIWRKLVALLGVFAMLLMLVIVMRSRRARPGSLPPPTVEIADVAARLEAHVRHLAGTIGPRHMLRPRTLNDAREYIEKRLIEFGYITELQEFEATGVRVANVEARATAATQRFVVLGAHYDTVPITPGANDNASGVAALLEVARLMRARTGGMAIRFVAFVNEEPPWFQTPAMGSLVYAARARQRGDDITAMISLETMGYYSDAAGSQTYPPPFQLFFPSTGNFLAAVSNFRSFGVLRRFSRAFRAVSPLPLIASPAPERIVGVGWSDHWAFWQQGYPALMLTDTALFRYPHYHEPTDTPDKLDYVRLAYAVQGVRGGVDALAR